jgi:hypothetical protein
MLRYKRYDRFYDRFQVPGYDLTAVEQASRRQLLRAFWALLALAAVVVLALVIYSNCRYPLDRTTNYASDEEHFKYGSIGSDNQLRGLPYELFMVLPEVFSDLLPAGAPHDYTAFGFIQEPGHELPIGFSKRRHVIDFAGFNCAFCHTGSVREAPGAPPRIIPGMPANTVDLWKFFKFLMDAAADRRFTPEVLIPHMQQRHKLNGFEETLYKVEIIAQVRSALLDQKQRVARIFRDNPPWGPGRVDTFGPYKAIQHNFDLERLPAAEVIGTADLPSLWNQGPRNGMRLHWDGNNDSVRERNFSASFGAGATPSTVDIGALDRVQGWIWTLASPRYPFAVDAAAAARGRAHYMQHCYACHGTQDFGREFAEHGFKVGGDLRLGMVEPRASLLPRNRTDPYRLDSFTWELSVHQATLLADTPEQLKRFRKTDGYATMPLDGIWARAPYLHNGSVPTLTDLLQPAARRPKTFYRKDDVYDQVRGGFVSDAQAIGADRDRYFLYDTALPGNGNVGHEYGVDELDDTQKRELVEFLKTM